jgi:hypothetical protein
MPLRDHFRPPLDDERQWEGFHATWPVLIVAGLRRLLPPGFYASPRVHAGASAEVDVGAFGSEPRPASPATEGNGGGVAVATAPATSVYAPPLPTLVTPTDLPTQDEYEVRVFDERRRSRLVAAVEIVSPANKDRPAHRRAFVRKCAGLLREGVSVTVVDIVTTRTTSLYEELLDEIGLSDPALSPEAPAIYAAVCRLARPEEEWRLEAWLTPLTLGTPLPTTPLWITADLAVPLDLEASYEQSCDILGIV